MIISNFFGPYGAIFLVWILVGIMVANAATVKWRGYPVDRRTKQNPVFVACLLEYISIRWVIIMLMGPVGLLVFVQSVILAIKHPILFAKGFPGQAFGRNVWLRRVNNVEPRDIAQH